MNTGDQGLSRVRRIGENENRVSQDGEHSTRTPDSQESESWVRVECSPF